MRHPLQKSAIVHLQQEDGESMLLYHSAYLERAMDQRRRDLRAEFQSADTPTLLKEFTPFSQLSFPEKFRACLDLGLDRGLRQEVAEALLKERTIPK